MRPRASRSSIAICELVAILSGFCACGASGEPARDSTRVPHAALELRSTQRGLSRCTAGSLAAFSPSSGRVIERSAVRSEIYRLSRHVASEEVACGEPAACLRFAESHAAERARQHDPPLQARASIRTRTPGVSATLRVDGVSSTRLFQSTSSVVAHVRRLRADGHSVEWLHLGMHIDRDPGHVDIWYMTAIQNHALPTLTMAWQAHGDFSPFEAALQLAEELDASDIVLEHSTPALHSETSGTGDFALVLRCRAELRGNLRPAPRLPRRHGLIHYPEVGQRRLTSAHTPLPASR